MSWRLAKHRYGIAGSICSNGHKHFPPRQICNECGSPTSTFRFSGRGQVVSYTTIHTAPDGFERLVPYTIGLVQLEEGPVVSGHVVHSDGDIIGKDVRFIFRKLHEDGKGGIINYGFKFELDD